MLGAMGDADLVEHPVDARLALAGRDVVIEQGKLDIFADRQFVDQVEALEDEADVALAGVRKLGLGEAGDLLAVEYVGAFGRAIQHAHDVE